MRVVFAALCTPAMLAGACSSRVYYVDDRQPAEDAALPVDARALLSEGCARVLGWYDAPRALCWSNTVDLRELSFAAASEACADFGAGFRLPTRDELGGLLAGCTNSPCPVAEGPGLNGCYWPQPLFGSCELPFWTSSQADLAEQHAAIDFAHGSVLGRPSDAPGYVRCVRDP